MRVFGVVGWKNNGKTTLVERLVAYLTAQGYRVSTVKHAHHEVDLDQPGKDTWRHRQAGADEVVLATARRWAVIHELRGAPEPQSGCAARPDDPGRPGHRRGLQALPPPQARGASARARHPAPGRRGFLDRRPRHRRAVPGSHLPQFGLDDVPAIAAFVLARVGIGAPA